MKPITLFWYFFVFFPEASGAPFLALSSYLANDIMLQEKQYYPDERVSSHGHLCSTYRTQPVDQIPRECVYEAICGIWPDPKYGSCFSARTAPRGFISLGQLQKLSLVCRKQAICGFPEIKAPFLVPKPKPKDQHAQWYRGEHGSNNYGAGKKFLPKEYGRETDPDARMQADSPFDSKNSGDSGDFGESKNSKNSKDSEDFDFGDSFDFEESGGEIEEEVILGDDFNAEKPQNQGSEHRNGQQSSSVKSTETASINGEVLRVDSPSFNKTLFLAKAHF